MKKSIHPQIHTISYKCRCGTTGTIQSTLKQPLHPDACYACHPAYPNTSNKRAAAPKAGPVERFNKKYARRSSSSNTDAKS